MNLDIRLPIGLLFTFLGVLLVLYGLATQFTQPGIYERSLRHQRQPLVGPGAARVWRHHDLLRPQADAPTVAHRLIEEPRPCRACRLCSPPRQRPRSCSR